MVTERELAEITRTQIELQDKFRKVPAEGKIVSYLGKEFIVHRGVFWPHPDSMPLVENYRIELGESVLDVCTGSGVLAIFSAYKRAGKVVALDKNPEAVRAARENAARHGFATTIDVRLSYMFGALSREETFDVITGNLPFRNKEAADRVEASMWDTNLSAHRRFFQSVEEHLNPNGRIYLSHANYGAVDEMKAMAAARGFTVQLIGEKPIEGTPRIFYAFELRKIV